MKTPDEITRLSAADLERISLDPSVALPEDLSGKVLSAVHGPSRRWMLPAGIAAAAAAAILLAVGLTWNPAPKDTFDDPYLAYAEVEKAFAKISDTFAYGAEKVSGTQTSFDKLNYWK